MKKKYIVFSISLLLTQAAVVNANAEDQGLMNEVHSTAIHSAGSQNNEQPFWSEEQKKQAELEAKYKKEIAENPENKDAYSYLAGLYLSNNKTAEAVDAYQEAITHNPTNAKLFAALSIAYLHQSRYTMAQAMADEALRIDPSMQQVKKINEYITAKLDAIDAASKVSQEDVSKAKSGPSMDLMKTMPVDAVHGNSSALRDQNLSDWTHNP